MYKQAKYGDKFDIPEELRATLKKIKFTVTVTVKMTFKQTMKTMKEQTMSKGLKLMWN